MSTLPAMEYQALYRKYRPQRFDQVIGQEHVTVTLAREIAGGRVAHAYLFTGPRGTGKTTTARLLAMALNCPDRGPDSEPCGACPSCAGVASSASMDVMELDAASHNKVEDIRELRAGVSTVASVGGARRVFILDEAHMLTKSAANALLKTLEEPPEHVHFVLATTEPYRLLDTVRSRSQRFDFHLVPTDTLTDHLRWIAEAEGFEATDGALLAVARRAAGSVRDSLSLLEQVAARDGTVTEEGVQAALGVAGPESLMKLVDAVADEAPAAALELVAHLSAGGVDLRRFAGDALGFFRGVFLTHYSSDVREFTDEPPEVIEHWQEVAGRIPAALVMRSIDILGEALVKLREGRDERMMLELAVLKLSRPELDDRPEGLLRRIERLEKGRPVAPARSPAPAARPRPLLPRRPPPRPPPLRRLCRSPGGHSGLSASGAAVHPGVRPATLRCGPGPHLAAAQQRGHRRVGWQAGCVLPRGCSGRSGRFHSGATPSGRVRASLQDSFDGRRSGRAARSGGREAPRQVGEDRLPDGGRDRRVARAECRTGSPTPAGSDARVRAGAGCP